MRTSIGEATFDAGPGEVIWMAANGMSGAGVNVGVGCGVGLGGIGVSVGVRLGVMTAAVCADIVPLMD